MKIVQRDNHTGHPHDLMRTIRRRSRQVRNRYEGQHRAPEGRHRAPESTLLERLTGEAS